MTRKVAGIALMHLNAVSYYDNSASTSKKKKKDIFIQVPNWELKKYSFVIAKQENWSYENKSF